MKISKRKIEASEESREKAQKLIENMVFEPIDIGEYRKVLDKYCKEYKASFHYELMSRADMCEFPWEVCSKILEYYLVIESYKGYTEE